MLKNAYSLGLGTHLLSRYLDQETAKWSFTSLSQAATSLTTQTQRQSR